MGIFDYNLHLVYDKHLLHRNIDVILLLKVIVFYVVRLIDNVLFQSNLFIYKSIWWMLNVSILVNNHFTMNRFNLVIRRYFIIILAQITYNNGRVLW